MKILVQRVKTYKLQKSTVILPIHLEVNNEKTKYTFKCHEQN